MLKSGDLTTDVGTLLYGAEAVEAGLIDSLGTLSDALAELHRRVDEYKKQ
jgi:ClpP class serine protease